MTADTRTPTEKLAAALLILAADYLDASRAIDTKTTKAALDGATRAAVALGVGGGMTEAGVFLIALDAAKARRRPASGTASYRAWFADGTAAVAAALDAGL